ncbi:MULTISPECIES: hypothetical protein [Burkholderia]|uniref:hypothetical protein n=1 Tax=Burkholderia TaxID=32008 RepID=UPI000A44F7C5|nr:MULTISPECIES: hypothetical protein [Burkholderia]MDP9550199.1 hypothetical protein [Burkholderia cepacia]MBR8473913.1 hypothetical protein [Burkholderia cenocepacia]MDO5919718.1 hypothetical protein [Burkholderia cenocepacia]MDP9600187.1 hypothetical protein [Burkholderia cepacia]MDP9627922.1 hypothetical protein [Burkholderia cepacia]
MNEIKHTPGPWETNGLRIWAKVMFSDSQALELATMSHFVPCTERAATAQLMTAAPDMAEILEIIAADADAGEILLTSGIRIALDAALIKAGRKAAPEPVRHFRACGEDL